MRQLIQGRMRKRALLTIEVKVAPALVAGPADECIARFDFPGARAEAEQGEDLAVGAHEVAQLCARHGLMAEVVMALDVGIPQQGVVFGGDRIDTQPGKLHLRGGALGGARRARCADARDR